MKNYNDSRMDNLDYLHLFIKLKRLYGESSRNNNLFEKFVKSFKWDDVYKTLDETTVYVKGDFKLEVISLDVFDASFRPEVMIGDEIIYFWKP